MGRHRFIQNLEFYGKIPYLATGVDVYVCGNGESQRLLASGEGASVFTPRLSPNKDEVAWGGITAGAMRLRLCNLAPGSSPTTLVSGLGPAHDVQSAWSPDGTQIAYVKVVGSLFGGTWSIRRIDRDGSNDTELISLGAEQVSAVSYSPSGDYIMYSIASVPDGSHLWVMNADGTGATEIYTPAYELALSVRSIPSWQRDTDVIGFSDMQVASTNKFYTINPDGTGLTEFFDDTGGEYWCHGRDAWLTDNSGMVCLRRTNGATVFTASDSVLAIVFTDGTAADVSPSQDLNEFAPRNIPSIQTTGDEAWRIYFRTNPSGTVLMRSLLEDGSDERTEHTPSPTPFSFEGAT